MIQYLPAAISALGGLGTLFGGKKRPGALPGAAADAGLASDLRGYITRGLTDMGGNSAGRYRASLDRDTADTFARQEATMANRAARSGGYGGSAHMLNQGALSRAESGAYGDNILAAERLAGATQDRQMGYITGIQGLRNDLMRGARIEQGRGDQAYAEDQADRGALSQQLFGAAGRALTGGLIGGDLSSASAAGFAPGYLDHLFNEEAN